MLLDVRVEARLFVRLAIQVVEIRFVVGLDCGATKEEADLFEEREGKEQIQ